VSVATWFRSIKSWFYYADSGTLSGGRTNARRTRDPDCARDTEFVVHMRCSLDQTRLKLTTCVQTQTDLISKWVRVEIAEGSPMHRHNESTRPELQMHVGAWIM
jgi:hypothetical protein